MEILLFLLLYNLAITDIKYLLILEKNWVATQHSYEQLSQYCMQIMHFSIQMSI